MRRAWRACAVVAVLSVAAAHGPASQTQVGNDASRTWYETLEEVWRLPGHRYTRDITEAAAATPGIVAIAREHVAAGDIDRLRFACAVLSHADDVAALDPLLKIAEREDLPRMDRVEAKWAAEWISGHSHLDLTGRSGEEVPELSEQVRQLRAWLAERDPFSDEERLAACRTYLDWGLRELAVLVREDRPLTDGGDPLNGIQMFWDLGFTATTDPRAAAQLIVDVLAGLRGLPATLAGSVWDDLIADLQVVFMHRVQFWTGPVPGLAELAPVVLTGRKPTRAETEAVLAGFLGWWEKRRQETPLAWRMDLLARAGYETGPGSSAEQIGLAMMRALREGSPVEAKTAADVLRELGLVLTAVPAPDIELAYGLGPKLRDCLAYDLCRGQALREAAAGLAKSEGRLHWDAEKRTWVLEPDGR